MESHTERRLPAPSPNSARTVYVTERGLFIKLQALVYDILPSTTAVFSYATGSKKNNNCQLPSSFLLVLKQ